MCGRYGCLIEDEFIQVRSVIQNISLPLVEDNAGSFNIHKAEISPTDMAPVILKTATGIAFEDVKFGFKKWDGKGVVINARVETLQTKDMFSRLLAAGRCAVPAGEYYEWRKIGREKVKNYIKDKDGNLLFMAGLYREGPESREFVIITKDACSNISHIHDRMPVILGADQIEPWLSGELSSEDIAKIAFSAVAAPCMDEDMQLSIWD